MPHAPHTDFLLLTLAALLGLLVGSFLNVVIHRLPQMLQRRWAAECAALRGEEASTARPAERYDLLWPRSHCPACQTPIPWYRNVPLVSFALQRGRCAVCGAAIRWRYPLVELVSAALWAGCAWRYGATAAALAWAGFGSVLLALAAIDWDT
ncbi:MAG: prepilin peptidase, partial [Burkholderiaceae bacterium]|nr:prepilin peptidase [Burkholderiaceae bacterium]